MVRHNDRPEVATGTTVPTQRQCAEAALELGLGVIRRIVDDVRQQKPRGEMLWPFDPLGLAVMSSMQAVLIGFRGLRVGRVQCLDGETFDTFTASTRAAVGSVFSYPPFALWAAMQNIPLAPEGSILRVGNWWPYKGRFLNWYEQRFAPSVDEASKAADASQVALRRLWRDHHERHLHRLWCSPNEVFRAFKSAMRHKERMTKIPAWKLWAFLWHEVNAVSMPIHAEKSLREIHGKRKRMPTEQRETNDRVAATHAIVEASRPRRGARDFNFNQRVTKQGKLCWDCGRATDAVVNRLRKWRRSLGRPTEAPAADLARDGRFEGAAQDAEYCSVSEASDAVVAERTRRRAKDLMDTLVVRVSRVLDERGAGSAHQRVLRDKVTELLRGDVSVAEAARGGCQRSNLSAALSQLRTSIRTDDAFEDLRRIYDEFFGAEQ